MVHFKVIKGKVYMYSGNKCIKPLGNAEDVDIDKMLYLRRKYKNENSRN